MKTTAKNSRFECLECRNEVTVDEKLNLMDVCECPFCGIEYEITSKNDSEIDLKIIEEEK